MLKRRYPASCASQNGLRYSVTPRGLGWTEVSNILEHYKNNISNIIVPLNSNVLVILLVAQCMIDRVLLIRPRLLVAWAVIDIRDSPQVLKVLVLNLLLSGALNL
jgi:hypothetical protein